MSQQAVEAITPSILVVDDERQIHSSLRLRLGDNYRVTCQFDPHEALELIRRHPFDLCITDVHMPAMDGLTFIEAARTVDPALGYVVLSGHDSEENLRRTIPLHIFEFISKPLPDRKGFEARIPGWIASTRQRRHEQKLAKVAESIVRDLESALIERDVETTASETAREALLQAAGHLTTVQALLFNAVHKLEQTDRKTPSVAACVRSLQEAQRIAEETASVCDGFFASAYSDRETSPALIDSGMRHAMTIAQRRAKAEERQQWVDFSPLGREASIPGLSGIDYLLLLVPSLIHALELSPEKMTIQVRCEEFCRLDAAPREARWRSFLWVNRRNAMGSNPALVLCINSAAAPMEEALAESWLRGQTPNPLRTASAGILRGITKAKGLLGVSTRPHGERHELILVLPL